MPDTGHEPSWPPPGAREPLPVPEPRVPAGTYLPPSAVLPPLDGPVPHASDRTAAPVVVAPSPAAPTVGSRLRTLGSPHSRRVAGRRAIAIGSGVALVGFLLPWGTASLAGLAANWLVLWGLAGPGHWLVAAGLLGMGVITASSGRPEGWPVGLPAVILGALTLGLIWTQVFGPSRPFAVVIVLVGTALLIAGGTLEETGRHEAETQSVQPIPEGP